MIVALLHPGDMGVTVGQTLQASGHEVRWCVAGRSAATRRRAQQSGFQGMQALAAVLDGADAVVSVCPPAEALAVAKTVVDAGFEGVYVDANAVSPATVGRLQALLGPRLVDGGIIGPPARTPGTTRLYLSGPGAGAVAGWFEAGPLQALALDGPPGAASALKMCYAAYTKGASALLLLVRALAESDGVSDALLAEWALSQPGLTARSDATAQATAAKAWRFEGEMYEIADTVAAAGLPDGFHRAAAALYGRMASLKEAPAAGIDEVVAVLLGRH